MSGNEVAVGKGEGGDAGHLEDFFHAIRHDELPRADIEIGHRSALLCHLGNIAYRTESVLGIDPTNGHILDNTAAQRLWTREYQAGWEPEV
jgi:hypothetical protein